MFPIVIFAFNRPDLLRRLLDSLRCDPLYAASPKYFYIDGPRNEAERARIAETVAIAMEEKRGAKDAEVEVIASETNKGLAANIIGGITEVLSRHGACIVLEDDLVCAPGFLDYMNRALGLYRDDKRIISVCGYGLKVERPRDYRHEVYLLRRSSSWGWGTWADRWAGVDWDVSDWAEFEADRRARRSFNRGGSDMTSMLRGYINGQNNSWAIRFCYSQWRRGMYSLHPFESYIDNGGFGADATNCRQTYSRFKTTLRRDAAPVTLPAAGELQPDARIQRANRAYHSIPRRLYSLLRRLTDRRHSIIIKSIFNLGGVNQKN